jgi:hypothetical protein
MKNSPITPLRSLLLGLALLAAGNAHAVIVPITLQDLVDGGSITAGDKVFDQWSYNYDSSYLDSNFNVIPIDLTNIQVLPLSDGGMDPGPGLSFNILNGALDVTGDGTFDPSGIYTFKDLTLSFHVSTVGNLKIKDNTLTLSGHSLSVVNQDLGMYIAEDIGSTSGGSDLGTKSVERSGMVDPITGSLLQTSILSDTASFLPQDQIFVTKNILVWATDPQETASLTGFTQRFSQVPEPGTLFLLAPAVVGLLAMRRKGKARAV